jgi:3-deoxy-D-manno-octulosonic-acid transferase
VLVGPWRSSFLDIYEPLLHAGGAIEVRNAADIARHVQDWLQNPARRDAVTAIATTTLESLSGGLDRTSDAIIAMLSQPRPT